MRQVILIPDFEVGGFTVIVPSLSGRISEGNTEAEALANIKEAIELYIEVLTQDGKIIAPQHKELKLSALRTII
jgi:predicted RNase H-like HicB family nuclease